MTFWYQQHSLLALLLSPLSLLYRSVMALRYLAYQRGWFPITRVSKPVVVVGNLTVGGTGKTPVIIELVKQLQALGYRPGVISRGYGGKPPSLPFCVRPDSSAAQAGDEPILIAQKTQCPVIVDPNRPRAAQYAIDTAHCDVILSDDGLQHYALARDVELILNDAVRGNGNGWCLPAGPLREPIARGQRSHFQLNGANVTVDRCYPLLTPESACELEQFTGPVHAVAGIGNPNTFFDLLRKQGLEIVEHAYPDHHRFTPQDLEFEHDYPIIMTEKDAVKCRAFAQPNQFVLSIRAQLPEHLLPALQQHLNRSLSDG